MIDYDEIKALIKEINGGKEEETKMTNEEKKEVEDPCKDKKNCRGCAHYDGILCPRNMAAEEFKDNPAFFIAMFLIGIFGVVWLFNH